MKLSVANGMDIVLAVLFLVAVCRGWYVGLAMKVGNLAAMVGASITAGLGANFLKSTVSRQWIMPYLESRAGKDFPGFKDVEQGISLVAENIAYYLLFGVIFVVALVVFHHVVKVLKLVDHIPVVGTLNKAGGALAGFLVEFIFFFILGRILFGLIPMESWGQMGLTREAIEASYLLRVFVP